MSPRRTALGWLLAGAGLLAAALGGCEGPAGPAGPQGSVGEKGQDGDAGTPGAPGQNGDAGDNGRNAYLTGPGLKLDVVDTKLDASGAFTVTFHITDDGGIPLDREGLTTEGAVDTRFVLAWLDETADGQALQYTSYTTATQKSPITGMSADQAAADQGGTFEDVDPANGVYAYTFGASIQVVDPAKTHTLGVWATRSFQGQRYVANAVRDFLPAGGMPTVKRDVVELTACNACHGGLEAHGGVQRDVRICVLCHAPQTVDPDTGNTVDFKVIVHKIHAGRDLPSVMAGKPYQIVGDGQQVFDYSTVGYPQDLGHCTGCHTGSQADAWRTRTSRLVCSGCHDLTSYDQTPPAGMTAHPGGPQKDDSKCAVCHPSTNGLAGVDIVHLTPLFDPSSPKLALVIASVQKTAPGQTPEIVFTVTKNGAPLDIAASPLPSLAVTMAGPTTDYAWYTSYTIQGSGAVGQLVPDGGTPGQFRYVLPVPMDPAATGSVAFALEGYLQPGGSTGPRLTAPNPVAFAPVTDPIAVPRRTIVDTKLCNACHAQLDAHGGLRTEAQYCGFCHNGNKMNDLRVARVEGQTVTAGSVHLPGMIHGIHMGDALTQQPFVLYGYPGPTKASPGGTPIDFGQTRYPGDRKACWSCHAGPSYALPLPAGLLPSKTETLQCTEDPAADADSYCDTRVVASSSTSLPATAACTGCHDAPYVVAHAQTNTSPSGVEACATCHGPGTEQDVARVHTPAP